nr:tetratricopeptide repeat protein [Rhodoferax sp.]
MRALFVGSLTLLILAMAGCDVFSVPPTSAEIESVGMRALQAQDAGSLDQLNHWAKSGLTIAQRELALVYSTQVRTRREAVHWLNEASRAGDAQAQFMLGKAYHEGQLGLAQDYARAWSLFLSAAKTSDQASFMLSRMAKFGQGVPRDMKECVHWLQVSSDQGNGQAMYLLSTAYANGDGVDKDPKLARHWLEESAEKHFPVALQALALEMELTRETDAHHGLDAQHMMKEASDHRTMPWLRMQ